MKRLDLRLPDHRVTRECRICGAPVEVGQVVFCRTHSRWFQASRRKDYTPRHRGRPAVRVAPPQPDPGPYARILERRRKARCG